MYQFHLSITLLPDKKSKCVWLAFLTLLSDQKRSLTVYDLHPPPCYLIRSLTVYGLHSSPCYLIRSLTVYGLHLSRPVSWHTLGCSYQWVSRFCWFLDQDKLLLWAQLLLYLHQGLILQVNGHNKSPLHPIALTMKTILSPHLSHRVASFIYVYMYTAPVH